MSRKSSSDDVYRSFNILGKSFNIPIEDLNEYPSTLLADPVRLQSYWYPHLNAYFFSRNLQIFERTILPFYRSKARSNRIKYTSSIAIAEKHFREELEFYGLLQYYQIDDFNLLLLLLFKHRPDGFFQISIPLRLFLFRKCFCRSLIDLISSISCAMGMIEVIFYRCSSRSVRFIIVDSALSVVLLSILFFEQYSDRSWLKIQSILHHHLADALNIEERKEKKSSSYPLILVSYQSLMFTVQIVLSFVSYLMTILSYFDRSRDQKSSYFLFGIALRHLLLMPLCLADFCHLIDLLFYSGRRSLLVVSRLLMFSITLFLVCIWLGLIIYITDSSAMDEDSPLFPPSRYVYLIYQILLNVGYGDTNERTMFSFVMIVTMTLVFSPLLIILFQNILHELSSMTNESSHVHTFHRRTILHQLIENLHELSSSLSH